MEVLLFIAAGSRCTLVSMNKRRAGRQINNEHVELKSEAGNRVRVCARVRLFVRVFVCVCFIC